MGSSNSKPRSSENVLNLKNLLEIEARTLEQLQQEVVLRGSGNHPTINEHRLVEQHREVQEALRRCLVVLEEQQTKKEEPEDLNAKLYVQNQQELSDLRNKNIDTWLASLYSLPDAPKKEQK